MKRKKRLSNQGGNIFAMLVLMVLFLFLLTQLPPFQWKGFSTKTIDLFSDVRVDGALLDLPGGTWEEGMDEHSLPQEVMDSISTANAVEVVAPDTTVESPAGEKRPVPKRVDDIVLIPDSVMAGDPPRVADGVVLFEDFSSQQDGLSHLIGALQSGDLNRPVRIGFFGDSFIEGDIFTQDVRALLQGLYGGGGVGYMPMYSEAPGFRRSVTQTCSESGWEVHSVLKPKEVNWNVMTVHQQYFVPLSGAITTYRGSSRVGHADRWNLSRFVFIAQQDCSVELKIDNGSWQSFAVTGSPEVQSIVVPGETTSFSVRMGDTSGFYAIGAWLDNEQGIAVDNVSTRGYSGISLRLIPPARAEQMEQIAPYDAIVLQYGLNIISPNIIHYENYARKMVAVIQHLQACYPHTDIILMGVSDRCQKINGELTTMPAILGLTKAQRMAARTAGVVFWDTFQAMGGQGGMLDYVENKDANKDYTHINHKGGGRLAAEFVKSLQYVLNQ